MLQHKSLVSQVDSITSRPGPRNAKTRTIILRASEKARVCRPAQCTIVLLMSRF